jgi:hypothetical protein
MYADDEYSIHAEQDGVVVNAPQILMRHEHWTTGERPKDEVYRRQNAPERYAFGAALLDHRAALGFPRESSYPPELKAA